MITEAKIKAAMKSVVDEVVLNDGSAGRGAGSLLLVIRRRTGGDVSAAWFARVKRGGRRMKRAVGAYPELNLAAARRRLDDAVAGIASGSAVTGEAPTLAAMFAAYVDNLRDKGRASAGEVERALIRSPESAAAVLGRERAPGTVTPADVVAFVSRAYGRGHRGAADKGRAYLSAAFGWAMKAANDYTAKGRRDWGVTSNPAADVKRDAGATNTRERNLAADELRALWAATAPGAAGFDLATAAAVRALICCGQRVQETLRMHWVEVDLDAGVWTMPAPKTKGKKRPHSVPLPPQAVDVLRQLRALAEFDGPVFPAFGPGGHLSHRSVHQALARWLARPGCPVRAFQPRDLRRTWKSRAHDAGVDRFTRDLIQQHAKGDTGSRNYDRAEYLPQMREAMARWGEWLAANVTG